MAKHNSYQDESEGAPPRRLAQRRLVTIMACDFVGFSRSMALDEEGTARILKAHRAVIDSIIDLHGGRIFNTAGDSVLAEFGSSTDAVRAATEIQDALATRNRSLPTESRLDLRIGLHLGDVLARGDDLLGDAVNIAARIESVAEPGGVSMSASVHEQILGKLDLHFTPVGPTNLKNIERPISIFRLDRGGAADLPVRRAPEPARRLGGRMPWALAGVALCLVFATMLGGAIALLWGRGAFADRGTLSAAAPPSTAFASPAAGVASSTGPGQASHWLNGRWVGLVGPVPASDPFFCADLDDRCRVFNIFGVAGDGSFEGMFGFPNRLGSAQVQVSGRDIQLKTSAPTFVEVKLSESGMLAGRLTDRFGKSYAITLRRVR